METIRWVFGILLTISLICMSLVEWFVDYIIIPVSMLMIGTAFLYMVFNMNTWLEDRKK